MEKKKYYVYQHRTTTDGRVFYVGCGSEKRPYYKSNSRSKEWLDVYNNEGLVVEILHITDNKEEAFRIETEYIKKYGRIADDGTLINKSLYKGTGGIKYTKESHYMFGKNRSEETKRKISETMSKPILQYSKCGDFIREWTGATIAAKELNLHQSAICNCCNGERKSAGGFIWRFKE